LCWVIFPKSLGNSVVHTLTTLVGLPLLVSSGLFGLGVAINLRAVSMVKSVVTTFLTLAARAMSSQLSQSRIYFVAVS